MLVAKLLLTILLGLVVFLLFFTLVMVFVRTWVRYRGKNGQHTIWVGVGWFRIRLRPRGKRATNKAEKPKKSKPKKADKPKPENQPKRDLGSIFYVVLDFLEDMRGNLHLQTLKIDVLLGTKDAATTGILLGTCSAIVGMVYPYLEQNFNIKNGKIALDADFEASKTTWEAEAEASVRLIGVLWGLLQNRQKLKELKHLLKVDEEADV